MFDLLECKHCGADLPRLDYSDEFALVKGERSYRLKCRVCCCGTDPHDNVDDCIAEWNERSKKQWA